jgi:hypothetical protein
MEACVHGDKAHNCRNLKRSRSDRSGRRLMGFLEAIGGGIDQVHTGLPRQATLKLAPIFDYVNPCLNISSRKLQPRFYLFGASVASSPTSFNRVIIRSHIYSRSVHRITPWLQIAQPSRELDQNLSSSTTFTYPESLLGAATYEYRRHQQLSQQSCQ